MSNFTQRQCQRGFTLIELLVVLVILGLLMSVVGPRVMKYVGGAKTDTARMQIEELAGALDMYHLEVGRYPTQDMGLQALVQQPTGVARWNGPYLRKSNIQPTHGAVIMSIVFLVNMEHLICTH